jgi:hypothetical protein
MIAMFLMIVIAAAIGSIGTLAVTQSRHSENIADWQRVKRLKRTA